ncbi:U-box domain-containing protein 28 [Cinnamomum micranthum f. kanehirae]|uniref:U-box domain-containing protein n=1 Tax=Cinnamomum micranthum f. kanehirae TaxID=337451 RepID=A0A3S4P5S4_9MAGN|nr:U-box domain-containing protein 28 [Cinnamomum micranthum f. kanehirae]
MVRDDLVITVPSFFKCPISLDVMKSPVSLCTGVTYDRASIQTWLDNGNNTCPATMQPLQTKDFTPNHTLQRLIQIWESHSSNPSLLSQQLALKLIQSLTQPSPDSRLNSLTQLAHFLQHPDPESSDKNRELLVNAGSIPVLFGLLSGHGQSLELSRAVVRVLSLVLSDSENVRKKLKSDSVSIDSKPYLMILQSGDVDASTDAATVLEALISCRSDISAVTECEDLVSELIRLTSSATDARPICAGISCLVAIATRRRMRSQIVRLGAVPVIGRLLAGSDSGEVAEKVLKLLETLSTCSEGRAAICEDPAVVPAVVQKMRKVSQAATERAVVVLWSVCHLFRDGRAQEAVAKGNGLTKILLVMQSECSPAARQMCSDLVKIFRVNSKSCLSSYDTKTTHIMPF